jgi:hypothetical protein
MYHPTMSKTGRILFYPIIKFCEWLGENHPVLLVKMRYFAYFHKLPNLKEPKDMNEKILYMKLYTDTSRWTELADKYKVRDYVTSCGLSRYLIPLIGMWTDVEDIDFGALPNSFIFKANNGVGKNELMMVRNKSTLNIDETKKFLDELLKRKHVGVLSGEPHYRTMKPCIIAEELLPMEKGEKSPVDYKIYCTNGRAQYIWVCSGRDNTGTDVMTYDREWNPRPDLCVFDSRYREGKVIHKPTNLDEMIRVAETLVKPFPFVRLDLYNIKGRIYFGEMTFTPLGGMVNFHPQEFLDELGTKIDLNYPNN